MGLAMAGSAPASAADALAAHDYLLSCAGCHTPAGTGSRTVPTLHGLDRLLAHRDGRAYVLHVPGVASAPLSDARLAALLDWVFTHFGNDTQTHFTPAEVAAARVAPFADPKAARAALE